MSRGKGPGLKPGHSGMEKEQQVGREPEERGILVIKVMAGTRCHLLQLNKVKTEC